MTANAPFAVIPAGSAAMAAIATSVTKSCLSANHPIPDVRERKTDVQKRTGRKCAPEATLSDCRHHKRPKHRYEHHPRPSYPATVDPVQCPICCDQTYKNEDDRTQICGPKWQCSTSRPRIHPLMLGENRQWVNDRFTSLPSRSGPLLPAKSGLPANAPDYVVQNRSIAACLRTVKGPVSSMASWR